MTGIMSPTYKEPTPTSPASAGFFLCPQGLRPGKGVPLFGNPGKFARMGVPCFADSLQDRGYRLL